MSPLALSPSQTHAAARCTPLDRSPASYRDGTRTPYARRISRDLRAAHAIKRTYYQES